MLNSCSYDRLRAINKQAVSGENKMSEEEEIEKKEKEKAAAEPTAPPSMGNDWGDGKGSGRTRLFANPDDFDILCDREGGTNYIFHGSELNCNIDYLEYDPEIQRINVYTKGGQVFDLGAKIQWLVRPYLAKDQYLFIIRTKDGESIDGIEVHLKIKEPEVEKTLN